MAKYGQFCLLSILTISNDGHCLLSISHTVGMAKYGQFSLLSILTISNDGHCLLSISHTVGMAKYGQIYHFGRCTGILSVFGVLDEMLSAFHVIMVIFVYRFSRHFACS